MKSAVISMAVLLTLAMVTAGANSLNPPQGSTAGSDSKGQQGEKEKKDQKEKKEGGEQGGFLSGTKKVSAAGSQQQGLTATGGTKGVGEEGAAIGAVQPNSEHRAFVSAMEGFTIPAADLNQFQEDGKLVPAK